MKTKIKLVLVLMIFYSMQIIFAQETVHSAGPIPNLKLERIHTVVNTIDNPASIAFGHNSQGNATLSMPIPAGTPFTTLGSFTPPGGSFASSMIKGGDNNYYLITIEPALYQFNTGTGAVTLLGSITGMAGQQPNGISFNPANSTYYLISSTNLYSFNFSTRVATLIGSFGVAGSLMIDLCFTAAGVCYAYDLVTDAAYTVNITTGAATILGSLGYDANFGQGMSYDMETSTIYLSAFNNGTFTGQLRTMNPATDGTTLLTDWGLNQLAPFALNTQYGPPCPIGAPSNPSPVNGATNVAITGVSLVWTNGTGTVNNEVWFGPVGNVVKVYDGPAKTSHALPTLLYNTVYQWYIVCKDATCGTTGPTWSFTTMQDPFPLGWCDPFNNLNNWTILGPLGMANWSANNSSSAGGTPPELQMSWTPSFNGVSKIRSVVIPLINNWLVQYSFNFYFDWYADPSGTITVAVTYDDGTTSTPFYTLANPTGNVGPMIVSGSFTTPSSGSQNARLEITFSGNSFNNDNIYWDNMCIDWYLSGYPPNAPTNLTAQVIFNPGPQVQLNWQDNSVNENGFRIYRKFGYPNDPNDYLLVGTVGQNIIQYIDATVLPESTYTYRVFAYNQYGQNGSNTATIAVPVPVELISFTSEVDDNVVTLFWQTATETNNRGFEIERKAPSKSPPKGETSGNWERIGFVEGKGTTTEIQSYSFQDKPEPGKYIYRLKQIDFDGTFAYSPEVEAEVFAPTVFSLEQNYPNPFNPTTKIKYTIPFVETHRDASLLVTLKVFDILGNEVATLVDEEQTAGTYEIEFNASSGIRQLVSGIYFYQLKAGSFVETKKMVLLR